MLSAQQTAILNYIVNETVDNSLPKYASLNYKNMSRNGTVIKYII